MAKRSTASFLPKWLQTDKNKKFLHGTLDQLINSKSLEKIDGYIGKNFGPNYNINDPYVSTAGQFRTSYQLEPSVVYKNKGETEFAILYDDLINGIKANGGDVSNHNRLFEQEFYNWNGFIDYDKIINFNEYYWLPDGPGITKITASTIPTTKTYAIAKNANNKVFDVSPTYSNSNPTIYLVRGGTYDFEINQNSKVWIQTEPSTTGKSLTELNRDVRGVNGVTNNGITSGAIRFIVPSATAQQTISDLTKVADVDLRCVEYSFTQLNGMNIDTVVSRGGIDGQLFLDNKTVIFDEANKFSVYRIIINNNEIELRQITPVVATEKVSINEGSQFNGNEYYRISSANTFQLVPLLTAPLDTLYYQDENDSERYGVIKILEANDRKIDIVNDILEQKTYTAPNGVAFTNGMHVQTDNTFKQEGYRGNVYIIEGVGDSITLIPKIEHAAYELSNNDTKDYIVSNRGSADKNAWARNNNWYHKDVIETIAKLNDVDAEIDKEARANRPILEFKRNLGLYNSGSINAGFIDFVDVAEDDALSNKHNSSTIIIDGTTLSSSDNNKKIVFINDSEVDVRNKSYTIEIVDFQNNDSTEIRLVPSTEEFVAGDQIVIKSGNTEKGKSYWFNGNTWTESQRKTLVNQIPKFDIFDNEGISFGDTTKYKSTNFDGTKLFSYGIGSGNNDVELGFALKYKNFSNIGDIVFDNNYSIDEFEYDDNTKKINSGFVKITKSDRSTSYIDGWSKINTQSTQYQIVTYVANGTSTGFEIGVEPKDDELPNVVVFFDSIEKKTGWEYNVVDNRHVIEFTTTPTVNTQITIKVLSESPTTFGYYEIPTNLSNNAFNVSFNDISLGQIHNHISEVTRTASGFEGNFPGNSNLRDIPNAGSYQGTILQHSSGLILPGILLQDNHFSAVNAMKHASNEYTKFKQKFILAAETLDLEFIDIPGDVDKILASINNTKSPSFPFYHSDMIGHGNNKRIHNYTVTDHKIKNYQINEIFDPHANTNRSVLVYINDEQAMLDIDYKFNDNRASIELINEPTVNTKIKIVDYSNTAGNYIPPTPTKLGLYPKFEPMKFMDDTYAITVEMIQGHDGSLTKSYGGYIDDILIEFEKRIYNNIKTEYKSEVFDIYETIPGRWRDTKFTNSEFQDVLNRHFLTWAVKNNIDWTTHEGYERDNQFTWNYNKFTDSKTNDSLPGGWRGIYKLYYDTDRPHTHPWEMLGYTIKPTWWEDRYGQAPYTSDNNVLWEDLKDGKCWNPETESYDIKSLYIRKDLLEMIPVDDAGELKSPFNIMAVGNTTYELDDRWAIDDYGQTQVAWQKSSEYPFVIQIAQAVMRPAKYFGLMYDTDTIIRSKLTGNIVNKDTNKPLQRGDFKVPSVDQNIVNGYSFYVSNYLTFLGIANSEFKNIIDNVDIKLATKLSGYTDKKFLKVLAEQVSPNAISENVTIPDEDYELIITKTSPIIEAPYSGVIVQKTNSGYAIYGYNHTDPVFNVIPSIQSRRTNIHEILDKRFIEYKDFENTISAIPYGTEFSTQQQVFDFLISYGRYLTSLGYDFDNDNATVSGGIEVANWSMAGKEFGYWAQQEWGENIVITLSPSANKISFRRSDSMVDSLVNETSGKSVMNQSFENLSINKFKTKREDGAFELLPDATSGGIYFANISTVQYEHTLVFNNETIFNDIIYQPELGNRQNRLRLIGWRTGDWDGSLTAQGFILNRGIVDEWTQNTDYSKGQIIRHNDKLFTANENHTSDLIFDFEKWIPTDSFKIGLLPNWDTLGGNFESFYDVDTTNLESDADRFGKSIIGYQSRDYLTNLGLDDVSQVKFYQGMIREKGTKNAIDKFLRARLDNTTTDIDMHEEWAIRVGEYGGLDINSKVELELQSNDTTHNPIVIHTIDNADDAEEGAKNILTTDFYKAPPDITKNWIPVNSYKGLSGDSLPHAGYAKLIDADITLFDISNYTTLDNHIDKMEIGYHLYTASDNGDWNMYYLDITGSMVTSAQTSDNNTLLWTTKTNHNLSENDLIVVKNFGDASGVHRILRSTGLKNFETDKHVADVNETGKASVFKFNSIRYKNSSQLLDYSPSQGWKLNDKVFIDNINNEGWKVYQKTTEYTEQRTLTPNRFIAAESNLGEEFAINQANTIGVFGYPDVGNGEVIIYERNDDGILAESIKLMPSTGDTGFGRSVDINDNNIAITSDTGTVQIYTKTGDSLTQGFAWKLSGTGRQFSTAKFSKDGNKLFVGSKHSQTGLYIFERDNDTSTFTETQQIMGSSGTTDYTVTNFENKFVTVGDIIQYLNRDYTINVGGDISFISAPANASIIKIISGQGWNYRTSHETRIAAIDVGLDGNKFAISYGPNELLGIYNINDTTITRIKEFTTLIGVKSIAVNDDLTKIYAGIPSIDKFYQDNGEVYKIELNDNYEITQNISHEAKIHSQEFGSSLATNSTGDVLLVSAPNSVYESPVTFDNGDTSFDGSSSTFSDDLPSGGNVYAYQEIDDNLIQVQKFDSETIDSYDKFGETIQLLNSNDVYIGVPNDDSNNQTNTGAVIHYSNNTNNFVLHEEEKQLVDIERINHIFSYDKEKNEIINYYDWIDPIKGKIPGLADENIDFKTLWNPAIYANEGSATWGADQVGKIWWDLSTVKYVYAEQSDWAYRSIFWGNVFPGSSIDIYQWIESDKLPENYEGSGTPLDSNLYTTVTRKEGSLIRNRYFFWVKDVVDIIGDKTRSAKDVRDIIVDPTAFGLKYIAFLNSTDIALFNISKDIVDPGTILVVEYDKIKNNKIIHNEWELIKENVSDTILPINFKTKFIDSLSGADIANNNVPDTSLSISEQYGIQFRPRQSLFKNRTNALKVFTSSVNDILLRNNILASKNITGLLEREPEPQQAFVTKNWKAQTKYKINERIFYRGKTYRVYNGFTSGDTFIEPPTERAIVTATHSNGEIVQSRSFTIVNGGSGYTETPTITIHDSTGSGTGAIVSRVNLDNNGSIIDIGLSASGSGYDSTSTLVVTISTGADIEPIISQWQANTLYTKGQNISYQGETYSVTSDFTSGETFALEDSLALIYEWNQRVANTEEFGFVRIASVPVGFKVLVTNDSNIRNNGWALYSKNNQNEWVLQKSQSYDVTAHWEYINWYQTGYNDETFIDHNIDDRSDLVRLTITNGQIIKIDNNGDWELLRYNGSDYDTIGLYNATIRIKDSILTTDNRTEIRKIIETVLDNILIDDMSAQFNKTIFNMLYHVLDEQPFVDWLFKTSFIGVNHRIRALDTLPYYRRDNQNYVSDFISEAKPYRTKIRDYVLNYHKTEPYSGDVTDFDLHSTYNTDLGYYRKPDGTVDGDNTLMTTGINKPWNDNRNSFELNDIIVSNKGSGYTTAPTVTITGGNGSGASARAVINDGSVTEIIVSNKGSGYTTAPTVTITGNATAYSELTNRVRTFDSVMKFDRIRYKSSVVDWAPETEYTTDHIIMNNGKSYSVTSGFTSAGIFDTTNLTELSNKDFNNAMDRTVALYEPTKTQPYKRLESVFPGIINITEGYEGDQISGLGFGLEPGFDRSGFDTTLFSNDNNTDSDDIDNIISSSFGDTMLGTGAADIIVSGGNFVNQHGPQAPEEMVPGTVLDSLNMEIYQRNTTPNPDEFISWRMWNDILDGTKYYRITSNRSTTLAQDLARNDTEIIVVNSAVLFTPDVDDNQPGVIWIGSERIVYWEIDTSDTDDESNTIHKLKRIQRGTMGTSTPVTHYSTNRVIDGSARQEILDGHDNIWYAVNSASRLDQQTTIQATFLNEFDGATSEEIKGDDDTARNPSNS